MKNCLEFIWYAICSWRRDLFVANRWAEMRILYGISYLVPKKYGQLYRGTCWMGMDKLMDLLCERANEAGNTGKRRFWDPEVVSWRYFQWMRGMRP
jgi:hypothetical protein